MHDPNNVYYQKSLMKRLRFTTALFCLSITDPGRLAIALYSEGLINRLASMRAKLVTLTELERSQELLSVVWQKVAINEDAFHKLFKVISQDPTMEGLCSLLKKTVGKECA